MQKNDSLKAASDTHNKTGSVPINRRNLKRPSRIKTPADSTPTGLNLRTDEKLDLAETIKVAARERAFLVEKPAVETKSIIGEKNFQELKTPASPTEEQLAGEIAYIKNVISAIEGKTEAKAEEKAQAKTEVEVKTEKKAEEKVNPELKSAIKNALRDAIEAERRVEVKTKPKAVAEAKAESKAKVAVEAKVEPKVKAKAETKIRVATKPKRKIAVETESKTTMSSKVNMAKVNSRMKARSSAMRPAVERPSAKELKERAIKKALSSATNYTPEKNEKTHLRFGMGRVVLALSCAAAVVFAIVYFVNLNMPDMSLKVAAMQSGINATYPSYVPRGFNISNISSEDGKISLSFQNGETGDSFVIEEEESSWDAGALLTNYVKKEFDADYSSVREQGLTIYMDNTHAAWVNGGIVYKLNITSGTLTKKQLRSIAVSL